MPGRLASSLLVAAALASLPGCLFMRPNPEFRACSSACLERKNGCLVAATTAEGVGRCDQDHQACMQPCLALPRTVAR